MDVAGSDWEDGGFGTHRELVASGVDWVVGLDCGKLNRLGNILERTLLL